MTGRLQKLREQRDLILKHLQWIETEIASEEPASTDSQPTTVEPSPAPPPSFQASETTPDTPDQEPVGALSHPGEPLEAGGARSLKSQVRKGCLLYFGLAWLALGAIVGAVYLTYS